MQVMSHRHAMPRIPSSALFAFVAITFLITWGLTGFAIFFPEVAEANFGKISGSHPFFFLATWAPAISAFGIVFYCSGPAGIRAFLSRLFLWRCPSGWVAFIAIGIPLVFLAGSLIKGGPLLSPLPPDGLGVAVAYLFFLGRSRSLDGAVLPNPCCNGTWPRSGPD